MRESSKVQCDVQARKEKVRVAEVLDLPSKLERVRQS